MSEFGIHTKVFALAAYAGRGLLANGAAASDLVETLLAIFRRAQIENVSIVVRYAEFSIVWRDGEGVPHDWQETIPGYKFNYGVLNAVTRAVSAYCEEESDEDETIEALKAAINAPSRYADHWVWLAIGVAGSSAALLYGADLFTMLGTFFATIILFLSASWLTKTRGWPTFFVQIAAGFFAVEVAFILKLIDPSVNPSHVVISVILLMLAGMTSTSALQDTVSGWYVAAMGRLFDGVMKSLGLVVGIKIGMLIAYHFGYDLSVSADISRENFRFAIMLGASAVIALTFTVISQIESRVMLATASLAMVSFAILSFASPLGEIWSRAVAAFAIGLLAVPAGLFFRVSASAFSYCAILSMLPGSMIYRGLWSVTTDESFTLLMMALAAGLALVCGLMSGEYTSTVLLRWIRKGKFSAYLPTFGTRRSYMQSAANYMQMPQGTRDESTPKPH